MTATDDAAAAPGMSDAALRRATGRAWAEWFALLDAWGAAQRAHPEIARWLEEAHGLPGWWAQGVTVGYERARGLRRRHQKADGFAVSASKTVPARPEVVFAAFADEAVRDRWLEPGTLRPRTAAPRRSARFDVAGGAGRVAVHLVPKGDKTAAQVQHERLASADDVEIWRAFWKERLARLVEVLASDGAGKQ